GAVGGWGWSQAQSASWVRSRPRGHRDPGCGLFRGENVVSYRFRIWRIVRVMSGQGLMGGLALAALLSGCGSDPTSGEPLPTSGVAPEKRLDSLGDGEIKSLCDWSRDHAAAVECDDGSVASHRAVD